ncbi:MAG: DUF2066 domain-containing protein, partial [Pseudomonadota bacterium]
MNATIKLACITFWVLVTFWILPAQTSLAQRTSGADFYHIHDIFVDVQAETELAAKEKAQSQALRRGFERLWQRLTRQRDWSALPALSESRLLGAVHGVGIGAEKFGGGRYIGNFSVRFKQEIIKAILEENAINYSTSRARPSVLVPLWQGSPLPLEEEEWAALWQDVLRSHDDFVVPIAKISLLEEASQQATIARDPIVLARVAGQAGLASIMIFTLRATGGQVIEGFVETLAPDWRFRQRERRFSVEADQPLDVALGPIILQLLYDQQDLWKSETLIQAHRAQQSLPVHIPIKTLDDWVELRGILQNVPQINNITLKAIASGHVDIVLDYSG